ncbi:DEAD/DEAH box helicase, partial [Francisella tularensis]|uniref:DEAD/DEAH box helicase n=1 Tax=Francisella tularensis TaxID=263 RepID=UPI0023819881
KNVPNLDVACIYCGQEYGSQIRALKQGLKVVVGTTGRVMDHIEKGTLQLDNLIALVLDEAYEILRMGFIDDVQFVLSHVY